MYTLVFIMFFYDFVVSIRNDLTFIYSVKSGRDPPENINVIIEIPKGSNIKYEIDIECGLLLVDRKLPTSMVYPFNYGFIPMTRESNGDPVDVFILGDDPLLPMSIIQAHPLGILLTEDQDGQDSKIIAAPAKKVDDTYSGLTDLTSISIPIRNKLEHFVQHHKDLEEGKYVNIIGWENKNVAEKMITEAIESYRRIAGEYNK
jgi:inorganic pyrophosphatase